MEEHFCIQLNVFADMKINKYICNQIIQFRIMNKSTSNENIMSAEEASSSGFLHGSQFYMSPNFTDISLLHESENNTCRLFKAKRMGKWCVLKCLRTEYAGNPEYATLLQKEFEIGYKFSHHSIVQIISIEEIEGLGICIVMEYVEGRTLTEWLRERQRTKEQIVRIMQSIGDALDSIHQQQVIHRDIKPSNILITNNGDYVKIIDFGLSDADNYAILKQPAGTQRYIAPEQFSGDVAIDGRADIYSFGVMLSDMNESLRHHSRRLKNISRKCCQTDRDKRYSSLSDIPWHNRYLFVWKTVTAVLIAIFILIIAYWMGGRHSDIQNNETEMLPSKSEKPASAMLAATDTNHNAKSPEDNGMLASAPPAGTAKETETAMNKDDMEEAIRKATRDDFEYEIRKRAAGNTHIVTDSVISDALAKDNEERAARLESKIRNIVNRVAKPGSKDYLIYIGSANSIMHDEQAKFLTDRSNLKRMDDAFKKAEKIKAERMKKQRKN